MIFRLAIMIFVLAQGIHLKRQGETEQERFHLKIASCLHPLLPYPSGLQAVGESDETQLSYSGIEDTLKEVKES